MANTYIQSYFHVVFAVKYRKASIHPEWREQLHAVIGNLINETECRTIIVNGVSDHVHLLFWFSPKIALSEAMKSVKAKSSKWVNESGFLNHRFEWQRGYGAFTHSTSQVDRVKRYIQNQEKHHQKKSFQQEYIDWLDHYQIAYDPQYLFQEPI